MKHSDNLIKKNRATNYSKIRKTIKFSNGNASINLNEGAFGGREVKELLCKIDYILKMYGNKCKVIIFKSNDFRPVDKLSYIMLELIIYNLIKIYHKTIYYQLNINKININVNGLKWSLLCKPQVKCNTEGFECFETDKKSYVSFRSFRRLILPERPEKIAELMSDMRSFLTGCNLKKEYGKKISEIVSELADNACEHAKCECLIDVDVAENYINSKGEIFWAINICVVNFSNVLLGDQVKEKILFSDKRNNTRYLDMERAYHIHKDFFDANYTEQHFFTLVSFQESISGRKDEINSGGKGLADMLKELSNHSDKFQCYVLTGDKVIVFIPEYITIDKNGYTSFNKLNDFISKKPDESIISDSNTDVCGTSYNLTFIYKKE